MKEFVINEFLSLRLENGITNIYVNDKKILRCKAVLIDIPINDLDYNEFESIDEYIDEYKKVEAETKEKAKKLPPEVEFWGHCSNLHYWYLEHYDSNLIHHELVFPLLKALSKAGDMLAKTKFKDEIAKRYGSGYLSVMRYLEKEGYLGYLNEEELLLCARETLENSLRKLDHEAVNWLIRVYGYKLEARFGREEFLHTILNKNDAEIIIELGKLIGREIIIKRYVVNNHFTSFREEYKDPKRSPGTAYSIDVRDKSVTKLDISKCKINSLPENLTHLKELKSLILNQNNLKEIPKAILYIERLNYLALALCGIQDVPQWIKKLKSTVNLAGNPLNDKSKEIIKKLKNIEFN